MGGIWIPDRPYTESLIYRPLHCNRGSCSGDHSYTDPRSGHIVMRASLLEPTLLVDPRGCIKETPMTAHTDSGRMTPLDAHLEIYEAVSRNPFKRVRDSERWRWRLRHVNGNILATGEGYTDRVEARRIGIAVCGGTYTFDVVEHLTPVRPGQSPS